MKSMRGMYFGFFFFGGDGILENVLGFFYHFIDTA